MGRYWVTVIDANGCTINSTQELYVGIYNGPIKVKYGTTAGNAPAGTTYNAYLQNADWSSYTANGNTLQNTMILYNDVTGATWAHGSGYIYEIGTGCTFAVTSGGIISGQNCV